MIVSVLIGLGIALAAACVAFAALVLVVRTPGQSVGDLAKIFPHSARLAAALYRDRSLPGSVRWRLRVALVYNLQPINLIPDVVPVIGFADNLAVLIWALRSTVRIAGPEAVERHWKGSPTALEGLYRALRISRSHPSGEARRAGRRSDAEALR